MEKPHLEVDIQGKTYWMRFKTSVKTPQFRLSSIPLLLEEVSDEFLTKHESPEAAQKKLDRGSLEKFCQVLEVEEVQKELFEMLNKKVMEEREKNRKVTKRVTLDKASKGKNSPRETQIKDEKETDDDESENENSLEDIEEEEFIE